MAQDISTRVKRITKDRDYASLLTSIITEKNLSDTLARQVHDAINLDVATAPTNYLKVVNEICKYEGFNPRDIIADLLKKWEVVHNDLLADPGATEEVTIKVEIEGEETELMFTNNQSFAEDMQFICLMFITRGAAFEKIMKKSTVAMKDCMNLMKAKYDINVVKRRPGSQLEAKTITIPRIAASFPGITVGLFEKGYGRPIFDIQELYPQIDAPRAIFSPMISSVLPASDSKALAIVVAIAVKVDDVLHQVDTKTSLSALYQYVLASFNSTHTSEMVKQKYCEKWNLGNRVNGAFIYSDVVLSMVPLSKAFISRSRPNDTFLPTLLSQI